MTLDRIDRSPFIPEDFLQASRLAPRDQALKGGADDPGGIVLKEEVEIFEAEQHMRDAAIRKPAGESLLPFQGSDLSGPAEVIGIGKASVWAVVATTVSEEQGAGRPWEVFLNEPHGLEIAQCPAEELTPALRPVGRQSRVELGLNNDLIEERRDHQCDGEQGQEHGPGKSPLLARDKIAGYIGRRHGQPGV